MPTENIDRVPPPGIKQTFLTKACRRLLAVTFLIAFSLTAITGLLFNQNRDESRHAAAKILAQGYAQRIQERLQTALVSTYILASVVKQAGGQLSNFSEVAAELILRFPSVSALQLAPDGVVREIYPREGNQLAIGHDLLADRSRNREAAMAISLQQLTLAGPFDLIQGGVGAVGRLPIFMVNQWNESHFWGFANALVHLNSLLESAGFAGIIKAGYHYEIWRIDPNTEQRHVFAKSGEVPLVAPVEYVITIYNGRWILSLAPTEGWMRTADYLKTFGYSVVAALIITLFQYLGIRTLLRQAK